MLSELFVAQLHGVYRTYNQWENIFFLWESVPDGQEHSWLISKKVAKESAEIISFVLILHYVWHVQIEFCQCLAINGQKLTLGNLVNMVSQKEKLRIELKQVKNSLIMF